ncbi:MAG: hypothetical protein B0D92_07820 [Spirochaeta sp. LUC14_002_19_P3]|nr:MAG: hypothetical protein B0D92_07820 [Spirochaeta sp. LUC14_002_19_P3]
MIRLKKHLLIRLAHYLFLLPFLPGIQPLRASHSSGDLAIYFTGIAVVLSLIIYGNQRPLVTLENDRISVYLNYRHITETLPYSSITAWKKLSPRRIRIIPRELKPIDLYMNSKNADVLINRFEKENIHAL